MSNAIQNSPPQYDVAVDLDAYPRALANLVVSYLEGPIKNACIERFWNNLDIQYVYPNVRVIDETHWSKHEPFKDLKKSPLTLEVFQAVATLLPLVYHDAGVTILTIPKGLSEKLLETIGQSTAQGAKICYSPPYRHLKREVIESDSVREVSETYRVAITNDILSETACKNWEVMLEILKFAVPNRLDLLALTIMTFINKLGEAPHRLFPDDHVGGSMSICNEGMGRMYLDIVGRFVKEGVTVSLWGLKASVGLGAAAVIRC